jgi:hypothetical protein
MGLFDKAKKMLGKHDDQVVEGVDKATDIADDKTGRKYTEHLDKVDEVVADQLGGESSADPDAGAGAGAS